jgi:hypothetical protein
MPHFDLPRGITHCTRAVCQQNGPVQRQRYAVRCNRLLADRFFTALSEAIEKFMLRSGDVETVKIHYFVPHHYKVVHELLLGVRTCVDFRQSPELAV